MASDDGRMGIRRIAPWFAAASTVVGVAFAVVLNALAGSHGEETWTGVAWAAAVLASSGVGLVLAIRRASNPIGWLLLVNGLVLAVHQIATPYADYAVLEEPDALPGGEWAVLIHERAWPTLFICVTAIALVFPDGRLPSHRWRRVAVAATVSFAVLTVLSLLSAERYSEKFDHVSSPLPELSEAVLGVPFMVFGLGALASLVAAALALRTRMKRASHVERLQLKWLAYGAMLVPAAVVISVVESAITGGDGVATLIAITLALTAIPVAIGVAVMRYRLYEIDRLINRTLVYAVLTAGLAAVFAAVSLSLGVAIGSGSTLPTAAGTLAVALVFGPLRSRVQVLVDRRFDRARYEGLRKIGRFLEDLRAGRTAPETTGQVMAEATGDPGLELFFWLPAEERHVDASGRAVDRLPDTDRARTPVNRGALHLATVVHDPALAERPDLLDSVIEAAGLAIEIGRLRVEVRRQLAEVEQSRARIVTAGYEERRRLERDIHDGAQQRLVSIGLALRHVQAQLPEGSREAGELDATVAEVTDAIEELRELARGVRPAGLDEGLAPALRELASRAPLPIRVDATEERFDDGLETAAYFVASEALANAAKHAHATRVDLSAARREGRLVVSVSDDGVGGARPSEGSGLAGMTDRVSALGGRLDVDSPPGEGTTVTVELPCES
jgi:signal transduction histidine kinase